MLFGIERRLLARMMLPVGGYRKPQIRELAAKVGLRVADKRDSQEICFVTSGKHDEFVRQRRRRHRSLSGEIVTTEGRVVGTHPGIERFTIGQRKGLGVAMGEPYFVVRIDARNEAGRHRPAGRAGAPRADGQRLQLAASIRPRANFAARPKSATTVRRPPRRPKPSPTAGFDVGSISRGTALRPARRWCCTTGTA